MIPDATPSGDISKDRLRLWLKLLKAQSAIEAEIRRRLREDFATTLPRFDVMSALFRHSKGLKMSQISGLLKVSNGNVTGIVDRLVEDGQVIRVAVPGDRRAQLARLTPAGITAFERLAQAHEGWLNTMLGGIDEADIAALAAQLDNITDHLEADHAN